MKIKLAITYGIIIWILIYIATTLFNPIFNENLPHINLIVPVFTIIITGLFGILYIRSIESNEVIEGIISGIIFIIIDIIFDMLFFVLPNAKNLITNNYPMHIISITIITLLITTFIGYLAQMKIDLK